MQVLISLEIIISFSFWFILGFSIWFIFCKIINKEIILLEKLINIILVWVWIWLHIYWFLKNLEVPFIFDIIAGGSVWHLLWFNVIDLINKFKK